MRQSTHEKYLYDDETKEEYTERLRREFEERIFKTLDCMNPRFFFFTPLYPTYNK